MWKLIQREVASDSSSLVASGEIGSTSSAPDEPGQKRQKLFVDYPSGTDDETTSADCDVAVALTRYKSEMSLDQQVDPLSWWKTNGTAHTKLLPLAVKYLGSPATTVLCERLFSRAGFINDKMRAAFSADELNKLVC